MKHEWLADQTKLVSSAMETEQLAEKVRHALAMIGCEVEKETLL